MRTAVIAGAIQFVQYVTLTVNFRAIAHEQYAAAGATAAVSALLSYAIVKRIVADDSKYALAGMVTGGAVADMVGIWLTRAWQ